MNELLKVDLDKQTVSARELHEQVGSTERFSAWFERQLQYGFAENEDYTTVKVLTEVKNNGGVQQRELIDHNLTVDMAKQICMVQKNDTIDDVAFMSITMQDLRENIIRDGTTVEYKNGENQYGTKQSPDAQLYLQFSQKQTQATKILQDCLPKTKAVEVVEKDDGFDEFVGGREDV